MRACPETFTVIVPPLPSPFVNELIVPPPCIVKTPAVRAMLPAAPPWPVAADSAKIPESRWLRSSPAISV